MYVIRPARRSEQRAAVSVLLYRPETDTGELHRQIDTLLRYASRQHLSLEHCLVAGEQGTIETACLCVDAPGRTSSMFIPNHVPTPAHAELIVALLKEAVSAAQGRHVRLIQGLVAPGAATERDLFAQAGFDRLTELIYLERDVTAPIARGLPAPPVEWEPYSTRRHEEFARVVEATYEASLDCAVLSGVREIEDTLASHHSAGEFDPRLWLLAQVQGQPVGVLLLARMPERASVEVVYMGLVPEVRGHGLGATLLRRALDVARSQGVSLVTLTVDVENAPARALYAAFAFRESSRREVWMRILPCTTST
jgi:GNAT superfamily N-acetyltransferase